MRQDWSVLRWLLLVAAALGLASCAGQVPEALHPCGPFYYSGRQYTNSFLQWTPDGTEIVFRASLTYGQLAGLAGLDVVDTAGTSLRTLADVNPGNAFRHGFNADVSPDGRRVVYSSCEFHTGGGIFPQRQYFNYEIAVINLDGTAKRRLTLNEHLDHHPRWSPDGSQIAFLANPRSGYAELYAMAADGSNVRLVATTLTKEVTEYGQAIWNTNWDRTREELRQGKEVGKEEGAGLRAVVLAPPAWSPDGERLAFLVEDGVDWPLQKILYTVRADGTEMKRLAAVEGVPAWSPDGQRIAIAMHAGDEVALVTLAADGSEPKQITTITDRETFENQSSRYKFTVITVSWSPDGSQLLYTCDAGVCVVDVADGSVTELIEGVRVWDEETILAAWSPDGSRIAVLRTPSRSDFSLQDVIYTIARDGTDRRVLALGSPERLVAANADWGADRDAAACAEGFVVPKPQENAGLVRDCQTLIAMRDTLSEGLISQWHAEKPIGEWTGVEIGGVPNRVVRLHIRHTTGTLSPEIGDLANLEELTSAGFYGPIPAEIGKLANLRILRVIGGALKSIPPEIGMLVNLEKLYLVSNYMTGSIPPELGQLANLRELNLSDNSLEGSIPPELGQLANLRVLNLARNSLEGSIPPELGELANLQELNLSDNSLEGSIPPELGQLANLQWAHLYNNEFQGCVPATLLERGGAASGLEPCKTEE